MPSPISTPPLVPAPGRSTAISSLTDSSSRFVIPLSPPPPQHAELSPPPSEPSESSSPAMLLDYLSRLARFEPRLRRYAASKYIEGGPEPVSAFAGLTSAANSPARTPRTPAGAKERDNSARTFSMIDLERVLLSVRPGWWKGKGNGGSGGREPSPSRPAMRQTDSGGLDIDLSDVLGRGMGSARSTPPAQEEPGTGPGVASSPNLPQDKGPGLFLHYYTHDGLAKLLSTTGVLDALAELGYDKPHLVFDTSDDRQHRLSLVDTKLFSEDLNLGSQDRFVIDLYTRRRKGCVAVSLR